MKTILNFWEILQGKKVYITAAAMITYATLGVFLKLIEPERAVEMVFTALGMVGFRSALNKK